jgi:hypothetical protein
MDNALKRANQSFCLFYWSENSTFKKTGVPAMETSRENTSNHGNRPYG